MIIALLGRQPHLGVAELERTYGSNHVTWFSDTTACVKTAEFSVQQFGGIQKAGRVTAELKGDWTAVSKKVIQAYTQAWSGHQGKITLGVSAYGFARISGREVQRTGIILKSQLKKCGVNVRLVPNVEAALSSATSHHNKLGLSDNKVELIIVRNDQGSVIVAESTGAQNITALAKRDQGRPKRDAFVGMLPPKLALQMINLGAGSLSPTDSHDMVLLDPFCGTGVVLQEALLRGFSAYGTDISEKMVDYSTKNLQWLEATHRTRAPWKLTEGDAMTTKWQQPINVVVCETYLGQPFSAPPSPAKLREVRGNCNHIISTFLKNIAPQLPVETPLCIAVPAWRDSRGYFTHLPLIDTLDQLGYELVPFKNVVSKQLLYFREDQVVARQLLVLRRK